MRKITLLLTAALAGCWACNVLEVEMTEVPDTPAGSPLLFHATTESAQTKVYTDEALHVLWNADDRISIFPKLSRNKQFRFLGEDGATGGDFEEVASGVFGTGSEIGHNYAVYPYDARTGYVFDDQLLAWFPQSQTYRAGSFGPGANLMVARSDDYDLSFKNVGSYLCVKLYGEGLSVRSLILQGNGGETLSGPVIISFDAEGIPVMAFDTQRPEQLATEIALKADTPVALGATASEAVTFWMAVPPVRLSSGFSLTVVDADGGIHTKSTGKDLTFQRSTQLVMKAFGLEAAAPSPATEGLYPLSGAGYVFDCTTDQVNIYEAEGNAWVRFLRVPTLEMHEIGPIPLGAKAGDVLDATLSTSVEGVPTGEALPCRLTVRSIQGGRMTVVSDDGASYVFRF